MSTTPPSRKTDYTSRNILTVGIFGGGVAGFLAAMLLGVLKLGEDASITDWIMAVTAVAAAFISGLAVVLVSQTLQATRDTLTATQKMADDQKRLGDAQTRPWLLLEECVINEFEDSFSLSVSIKNYGTTPATNVRIQGQFVDYEYDEDERGIPVRYPVAVNNLASKSIAALAPSTSLSATFNIAFGHYDFKKMPAIELSWEYSNHDRTITGYADAQVICEINEYDRLRVASVSR